MSNRKEIWTLLFADLIQSYKNQPIPDCLCQFCFDWKSEEFRKSKWFGFAAQCKGMTIDEYTQFLDCLSK